MHAELQDEFVSQYPQLKAEVEFVNEMCYLFNTNDFEGIMKYQTHPYWSQHNLENIRHRSGASLLYCSLVNIVTVQHVQNFYLILTQLNWSQKYLRLFNTITGYHHEDEVLQTQELNTGFVQITQDMTLFRNSTRVTVSSDALMLFMNKTAHLWKHYHTTVQRVIDDLIQRDIRVLHSDNEHQIKQQTIDICEFLWWKLFDTDPEQGYDEGTYDTFRVINHPLIRFDWVSNLNPRLVHSIQEYCYRTELPQQPNEYHQNVALVYRPNKYYMLLQFWKRLGFNQPDWTLRWRSERECNAFFQVYPECRWHDNINLVDTMMQELHVLTSNITHISTATQRNLHHLTSLLRSNDLMHYMYRLISEYSLDVTSNNVTPLERVNASFYFPDLQSLDIPSVMKVQMCFYRLQLFHALFNHKVGEKYLKQLMLCFLKFVPQFISLLFEPLSQIEYEMSTICFTSLRLIDAYIIKTTGNLELPLTQDVTQYVYTNFITYFWKDAPNFWPLFVQVCIHGLKHLSLYKAETEHHHESIREALCFVDSYQAFMEHQMYAWIRGMCLGVSNCDISRWCKIEMIWVQPQLNLLTQEQQENLVHEQRTMMLRSSRKQTFKTKVFECSDLYKKILSFLI
jgi:hypothetical protein